MNRDFVEQWVEALESGEYQQGKSKLRTGVGSQRKYCCLGVAADLAIEQKIINGRWIAGGIVQTDKGEEVNWLPEELVDVLGLGDKNGALPERKVAYVPGLGPVISLSEANDEGASFHDIARIIREHVLNQENNDAK